MTENSVTSIKDAFLEIYTAIKDLSDDEILNNPGDGFQGHFESLQHLLAEEVDDSFVEDLLADREFVSITQHMGHLKTLNGLRMEIEHAQSMITSPDPWAYLRRFRFYPNYLKLAQMEFQSAGLESGDRVIFLGSGPLPLSLISLCIGHGIEGIGIEKDGNYARISERVVDSLDLTHRIGIVHGDHFSIPLDKADGLVIVGADAIPKKEIFKLLAKVLPDGAKLSYRIYEKGLRRLVDDKPIPELPEPLEEYARVRPEPPVNNTSIFLIKRSG